MIRSRTEGYRAAAFAFQASCFTTDFEVEDLESMGEVSCFMFVGEEKRVAAKSNLVYMR